jgi:hypothetical protein
MRGQGFPPTLPLPNSSRRNPPCPANYRLPENWCSESHSAIHFAARDLAASHLARNERQQSPVENIIDASVESATSRLMRPTAWLYAVGIAPNASTPESVRFLTDSAAKQQGIIPRDPSIGQFADVSASRRNAPERAKQPTDLSVARAVIPRVALKAQRRRGKNEAQRGTVPRMPALPCQHASPASCDRGSEWAQPSRSAQRSRRWMRSRAPAGRALGSFAKQSSTMRSRSPPITQPTS